MNEGYRAVVVGSTGAVGSELLRELLAAPRCESVVALVRRPIADAASPKLVQHVIDMADLEAETAKHALGCTVAFSTLGAGQPSKLSKEDFWRIDVEYAKAFALGCKAVGVEHISLLSSVGADLRSRTHYLRVKGAAEQTLIDQGFRRTSLFRPSLLVTEQTRYGWTGKVYQTVIPKLSWALPKRWHEITVKDLGRTMRLNAEAAASGVEHLYYPDFVRLLTSAR
ncbi:MAG TPA: hypothetical protein DGG94_00520 [Micromonosporaceae bacterium]|nr:hypothetical protein [Micromonosporaceae bacterium]